MIGYREQATTGVFRLFDVDGRLIGMEERGLESPLLDPLDLVFFGGGIIRAIGKGVVKGTVRTAPKVAALGAARLSSGALAVAIVGAMRTSLKGLSVRSLQFTLATAGRMATKGRTRTTSHPPSWNQIRKTSSRSARGQGSVSLHGQDATEWDRCTRWRSSFAKPIGRSCTFFTSSHIRSRANERYSSAGHSRGGRAARSVGDSLG